MTVTIVFIINFCPFPQVEHELLIKELTTHLYLKSEKSREKRAKLVAYMTDSAALAVKGTSTHCAHATYLGCYCYI